MFTGTFSIVVKTAVAAVVLFILARFMGKKQISQLSFFDYIVGISIGSVAAAMSVDQRISLSNGISSMIVWALFPIVFSFVSLHSITARRLLDGTPIVLIQSGKIVEKNLKISKFTVNDLLEELRLKDIFDITDVDFAILETNGKLSVLRTASKQSVTPADMNLSSSDEGLYGNIIIDGRLMKKNMKRMKIDERWLKENLKNSHVTSIENVLLASCNMKGLLHIDKKYDDPDDLNVFL